MALESGVGEQPPYLFGLRARYRQPGRHGRDQGFEGPEQDREALSFLRAADEEDPELGGALTKVLTGEVEVDPVRTTATQDELLALASSVEGRELQFGVVPRLDFYQRARGVYAIVHTLDSVPYGCFILHKGVVFD